LEDSHAHGTDASGNPILKDIGMFMRTELKSHFKDGDIKYIDPSYIIRWAALQACHQLHTGFAVACLYIIQDVWASRLQPVLRRRHPKVPVHHLQRCKHSPDGSN
jgi:hypothetical protein